MPVVHSRLITQLLEKANLLLAHYFDFKIDYYYNLFTKFKLLYHIVYIRIQTIADVFIIILELNISLIIKHKLIFLIKNSDKFERLRSAIECGVLTASRLGHRTSK